MAQFDLNLSHPRVLFDLADIDAFFLVDIQTPDYELLEFTGKRGFQVFSFHLFANGPLKLVLSFAVSSRSRTVGQFIKDYAKSPNIGLGSIGVVNQAFG